MQLSIDTILAIVSHYSSAAKYFKYKQQAIAAKGRAMIAIGLRRMITSVMIV